MAEADEEAECPEAERLRLDARERGGDVGGDRLPLAHGVLRRRRVEVARPVGSGISAQSPIAQHVLEAGHAQRRLRGERAAPRALDG